MSLYGLFNFEDWSFCTQDFIQSLSEHDYDFLIAKRDKQEYKKGEILFQENTLPKGIYFIHEGKVKKYKTFQEQEQILYIAGRGELVGYHAALSKKAYPGSAATLENSIMSFIPNEDLYNLLYNSPALSMAMVTLLSREFGVYANNDLLHAQGKAFQRVATALLYVREKFKDSNAETDDLFMDISKTDLSHMAGLTRETTIRTLADFKENGIIKTRGSKIWVKNLKKLVDLTGRNLSKE